jgi:two-component sensor histidine kinase
VASNETPTRETMQAFHRLQRLFERAPGIMAVLHGPTHVFELANIAYVRLVGPRDLLGKPIREALPEVEGQGFFELLDRVYTTGELFVGQGMGVKLRRTDDGPLQLRYVDFLYQPMVEDDGVISGIFVEGQDVTERVLAQAALKVLLEEKEALAQRNAAIAQELSHRMLNSFQIIETLFRFQADDLAEDDPARLSLETARLRVQSMALVHRQIYRIEHGTGSQDIDLGLYLQSLAAELARAFGRGRTVIDVQALEGITIDARQAGTIGLLTTELVINACKYAFPDNRPGSVTIRLTETGESYRLVVEDTGVGLPAGFDPAASAGLGMRLVDSFVQNLEGRLAFDTRTAGEGTRWVLTFPK